ncbi:hypothetical protein [Dankookia sp. P2]|uniref:hypothetical protein n=1 Tax=Dankookia sp. P2 TaxID=3423955 RepID=UPI003D67CF6F
MKALLATVEPHAPATQPVVADPSAKATPSAAQEAGPVHLAAVETPAATKAPAGIQAPAAAQDAGPAHLADPVQATEPGVAAAPAAKPADPLPAAAHPALDASQAALPVTLAQHDAPLHADTLEQLSPAMAAAHPLEPEHPLLPDPLASGIDHAAALLHPALGDLAFA